MVTSTDEFWAALGYASDRETAILQQLGYTRGWVSLHTDGERNKVIAGARAILRALRDNLPPVVSTSVPSPKDASGRPDDRWVLLRDLETARAKVEPWVFADTDYTPDAPITITHEPAVVMMLGDKQIVDANGLVAAHGWVTVRFDDRLSLAAVMAEMKRTWPKGLPSSRRPLGGRKLALVRFVCLESDPRDTWRARWETWNELHPDDGYQSAWAMQNAFRKAEKSLVGPDGLRWYHDAAYRETWLEDLMAPVRGAILQALRPMLADVAEVIDGYRRDTSQQEGGELP